MDESTSPAKSKIVVFGERVRAAIKRFDGWSNPFTGLGTARDKMVASAFGADNILPDDVLDALYHNDDIAATACDTVPEEALRKGYKVKIEISDPDDKLDVNEKEVKINEAASIAKAAKDHAAAMDLQKHFTDAWIWARVYGGAGLLLGIDDGLEQKEPLNEKAIKSFTHVNVIDKRYLMPLTWYDDPTQANYGTPRTYMVTPELSTGTRAAGSFEVHESRLILFGGVRTSLRKRQQNNGWEIGVIQRMHTVLKYFGISWAALANILQDANQGVFKMAGLMDALAAGDSDAIAKRLELIDISRSVARAVVLDQEGEDFNRQSFAWSGIDKPFEMLMLRMSAATRIPVTILMGQSPAGENATGESDFKWFYDRTATTQENYVKPRLTRIHRLIFLAKDGPTKGKEPDKWAIEFPPLLQMTEKEEGEIRKMQADTDAVYIDRQVVQPEEIAISRFGPDGDMAHTNINVAERVAMLEPVEPGEALAVKEIEGEKTAAASTAEMGGDVQRTALNGAQIASMVEVATKVATGEISVETGRAILMVAIPGLKVAEATEIAGQRIESLVPKTAPKQATPPAPAE